MLTSNNVSQLRYLLKLTRFDVLTWKRTADRNETFTTSSCEATFVATVWEDSLRRYFRLSNRDGKVLILASSADIDLLATLFAEVKNRAFDVNRTIASIVRLGVHDIPDDRSALSRKRGITTSRYSNYHSPAPQLRRKISAEMRSPYLSILRYKPRTIL